MGTCLLWRHLGLSTPGEPPSPLCLSQGLPGASFYFGLCLSFPQPWSLEKGGPGCWLDLSILEGQRMDSWGSLPLRSRYLAAVSWSGPFCCLLLSGTFLVFEDDKIAGVAGSCQPRELPYLRQQYWTGHSPLHPPRSSDPLDFPAVLSPYTCPCFPCVCRY